MSKKGGYVVFLAALYMLDVWIVAFAERGFSIMPYPYASTYAPETAPKRFVSGFKQPIPVRCSCKGTGSTP